MLNKPYEYGITFHLKNDVPEQRSAQLPFRGLLPPRFQRMMLTKRRR